MLTWYEMYYNILIYKLIILNKGSKMEKIIKLTQEQRNEIIDTIINVYKDIPNTEIYGDGLRDWNLPSPDELVELSDEALLEAEDDLKDFMNYFHL